MNVIQPTTKVEGYVARVVVTKLEEPIISEEVEEFVCRGKESCAHKLKYIIIYICT